jgi:hypothetical protein
LKIEDASAFQFDSVTDQPANHLASTLRSLEGAKGRLAQSFGPVGCQQAMRAAGHWIFRNPYGQTNAIQIRLRASLIGQKD